MGHSASPLPAIQLQVQLTRQHEAACRYQDTVPPGIAYSDKYWRNMDELLKAMNLFDGTEASLRRAGFKGCIHKSTESGSNEPGGCEGYFVSCWGCVGLTEGKKQGYNDMARLAQGLEAAPSGDSEVKEEYRW